MLQCEQKTGWPQFIDIVQTRCSRAEFENWLAPIRLVTEGSEEIVLEVPNVFVQEYLLENYKTLLKEYLPLRRNGDPALSFLIATVSPKPTPSSAGSTEGREASIDKIAFNPNYRFETFIEGSSNQFVKSAGLGVALRPGKTYSPLFIHGGVGLGKTHILHGIGHHIQEHHRNLKIQLITTEAFINNIVDALRSKSIDKMKRFYRNLDVLLVDDIQFLQNRPNFEEEFCNTFEALIHQNKQIVITSDKSPKQLKLSERMVGRMEWGLVAQMSPPDLETRVAILQNKADKLHLTLPHSVAFFLAERIAQNVRQLEGAINRLSACLRLQQTPLTTESVEQLLGDLFPITTPKKISVETILQHVAALFEVRVSDLKSDVRKKEIAFARQVAMYLAKELLDDALSSIAAALGGKTHSTLLHGWKKITEQIQDDEQLRRRIQIIRNQLEN
jgi:chromosomal replication initiator protein